MTDRPIIFSAPMVLAILREAENPGTGKTQTRRLATSPLAKAKPGDRLYVRESCHAISVAGSLFWAYDATPEPTGEWATYADGLPIAWNHGERSYCPSIHMPRFVSRLTLLVAEVRFQALQDISEADAWAEGVTSFAESLEPAGMWANLTEEERRGIVRVQFGSARKAFQCLWESLHGADSWEKNPDLVALTFDARPLNIDLLTEVDH